MTATKLRPVGEVFEVDGREYMRALVTEVAADRGSFTFECRDQAVTLGGPLHHHPALRPGASIWLTILDGGGLQWQETDPEVPPS